MSWGPGNKYSWLTWPNKYAEAVQLDVLYPFTKNPIRGFHFGTLLFTHVISKYIIELYGSAVCDTYLRCRHPGKTYKPKNNNRSIQLLWMLPVPFWIIELNSNLNSILNSQIKFHFEFTWSILLCANRPPWSLLWLITNYQPAPNQQLW